MDLLSIFPSMDLILEEKFLKSAKQGDVSETLVGAGSIVNYNGCVKSTGRIELVAGSPDNSEVTVFFEDMEFTIDEWKKVEVEFKNVSLSHNQLSEVTFNIGISGGSISSNVIMITRDSSTNGKLLFKSVNDSAVTRTDDINWELGALGTYKFAFENSKAICSVWNSEESQINDSLPTERVLKPFMRIKGLEGVLGEEKILSCDGIKLTFKK